MDEVYQEIAEKIKNRNVAFFIAAGASNDCPSSLPVAEVLFREFLSLVFGNDIDNNEALTSLRNKIRFEVFFQIFTDFFGSQAIGLLAILKTGRPNHNHLFIAELARMGHLSTVISTNFDSLVERALEEKNVDYDILYKNSDFTKYKFDERKIQLIKLHGTLSDKIGEDVSDSILISVNQVGKTLDKSKKNVLKKIIRENDLVFIGYSGMDDFDVLPVLLTTKSNKSIYWVNHKANEKLIKLNASDLIKDRPECINYNYGKILASRKRGLLIEGESKDFMSSLSLKLFNKNSVDKTAFNKPQYDFSYLKGWENQVNLKDNVDYLRGKISYKAGDYPGAISYFDKAAKSSKNAYAAILEKSTALHHNGETSLAKSLLKEILKSKRLPNQYLSRYLIQLGIIEAEANNFKSSRRLLNNAIKLNVKDSFQLSNLKNNIGVSYLIESDILKNKQAPIRQIRYRLHQALSNFNESLRLSKQFSEYFHYANLMDNVALTYDQLRIFDKAKPLHFKALSAYKALYQYREEGSCLDNIGVFYKEQGDCLSALKYFRNALNLKKKFSTPRRTALTSLNIAFLYFDAKKYTFALGWARAALETFKSENLLGYISVAEDLITKTQGYL